MPFTIHTEPTKSRLVTMGQADKVIENPPPNITSVADAMRDMGESFENLASTLDTFQQNTEKAMAAAVPIPESPPEKPKRGRPKKMAKDKDLNDVSGVKTIREDDAGEQGAIGSHGVNAPAQEKVPETSEGEDKSNG
jgi:predicted flap endonuclease-1-like 5' DNA nuclease